MVTDYYPDPVADTKMIQIILRYFPGSIYFFPQGSRDEEYLNSLNIFHENKERITVLQHSVEALNEVIAHEEINYVGTRLHGGTKCLQDGVDSVIIAVDNRAAEIGKDIGLPIVPRTELNLVVDWLEGRHMFPPIKLPKEAIQQWKGQFRKAIVA
ncbi:MAG: hypothetical protein ABSB22_05965 [Thermodesulfobacteriota bacterium]|jgi:hypothetical protein